MTAERRTIAFALGFAAACAAANPKLAFAQDSTSARRDTVAHRDTTVHRDTLARRDTTARRDTVALRDTAAHRPVRPRVAPTPEPEVPLGPLPPGSRFTFTRDSLAWTNALTLSDLLTAIPGVYLARGGFVGQSEYVVMAGRGAATVELFWDGMPMVPIGGDSIYVDAARIYLTYLRRVDVEVLPASLRVYLVSERHETFDDRSLVRVMSGDYASAMYAALFQKRWPAGIGLGLAANYVGSSGFSGTGRTDKAFDIWARLEWLPSARTGMVYEIRRQTQDRDVVTLSTGDIGAPARHGSRTDAQLRLFANRRAGGDGLGGELLLGSSGWGGDSTILNQGVHFVGGTLRYADPRASMELTGRIADQRAVHTLSVRGGVIPLPGILISGDAEADQLTGNRSSTRAHGAVSLFRGPFSIVGEASHANAVQAPALLLDTAQLTSDQSVRLGFTTRPLAGHVGFANRDAYQPLPFPDLPAIPALSPSSASTVFIADAKLQLIRSLTFSGWYVNPTSGGADFQPPTHGRAQITFRSKFWRTFRSGAFDLKVQASLESWSHGTAGPVELPGNSFYEGYLSFQIVGFIAFYDLRNAYNSRIGYVPGMAYPPNGQTFGVRWEFFN